MWPLPTINAGSVIPSASLATSLAVALGAGLLIGAERERRKAEGTLSTAAGVRTFALASLAGALAVALGGALLMAALTLGLGALTALSYGSTRRKDPGLTTEVALMAVLMIGGLSVERPDLAAGISVAVAVILVGREPLHHFIGSVMTRREWHDALILAAATLVVLPVLPDRAVGGMDMVNPRQIWLLTVLVMAVGTAAHIVNRWTGPRYGALLAGFISGFASGTATVAAMASWSARHPEMRAAALGGAVVSNTATLALLAGLVGIIEPALLAPLSLPIAAGGAVTLFTAGLHLRAFRQSPPTDLSSGPAFSIFKSLLFALSLTAIVALSIILNRHYGTDAVMVASTLSGLADLHSAAASLALLVEAGELAPAAAVWPVLAALSANTAAKIAIAFTVGGRAFGWALLPPLAAMVGIAWLGGFWGSA